MARMKKKVIIVGAGISGLTTGIYLLDNGYDVEIYEKHSVPGGECTGWIRNGQYIDGCAHWMVGTDPKSDLYPLWEHIGAFEEEKIISNDFLSYFELSDGSFFKFYADITKLEEEMLRIAPEDKTAIKKFINGVKHYMHVHIPTKKPLDMMNIFELASFGIKFLPMAFDFKRFKHISAEEYSHNFKNDDLSSVFRRFVEPDYNIHSFFYICQAFAKKDAGIVEGGSLKMMRRISDKFVAMGGKLHLNAPVKKILIKDNVALGILLESGERINANYVVCSTDIHHALFELLEGQYLDKDWNNKFENKHAYLIKSSILLSYKTKANLSKQPRMADYVVPKYDFLGSEITHFSIRNFAFDKSFISEEGSTLMSVLLPANEKSYEYLSSLTKEEYRKIKWEKALDFSKLVYKKMGLEPREMPLIDVCTPCTFERYCNAYHGAYMAFVTTKNSHGLMRPGIIKGLKNFVVGGQWIMPPGGLPVAIFSGKHAAMRICKMDKQKFINKEIKVK